MNIRVGAYQFVCTFHAHISCSSLQSSLFQNLMHHDTSPQSIRHTSSAPRETLGLADNVLLLSSVASTDKGHRTCDLVIFPDEVFELDCEWFFDKSSTFLVESLLDHEIKALPFHCELPLWDIFIIDLGHRTMVSYVKQFRTCQPSFVV